ncbi:MAG: ABC transporter substrate-binding protein [Ardenticatenaceae bacterium]|nr:ABC transporter substrate-binding protein [Ardenticatenaceae bacterium]
MINQSKLYKVMHNKWFVWVIVVLVIALAAGCGTPTAEPAAAPAEKNTENATAGNEKAALAKPIKVGYQTGLYMGIYYAAVENKFFEEEGLTNLEHKHFATGPVEAEAIAAGDIQVAFGMGSLPGVNARAQGIPLVNLGTHSQAGTGLLLRQDLVGKVDATNPDDIKGLTIAIPARANQQDYLVRLWLEKLGLNPDRDVKMVLLKFGDPQAAALTRKEVDIVATTEPIATKQMHDGLGEIIVTGQELVPGHDGANVAVTETWLEENPEQAKAILRATDKAMKWAHANPDEFYEVVSKWTKIDASLIKEAIEAKRIIMPEKLAPNVEFYYDLAGWLLKFGYVDEDPKPYVDAYLCCWEKYQQEAGVLR